MSKHDGIFLIGLVGATCLIVSWGLSSGGITIEQAGAVVRNILVLCMAWFLLESIQ